MENEYYIYSDDGGKFCKCRHHNDGEIELVGKNVSVSLRELQQKAMNPLMAKRKREKRGQGLR